jgi:hypothetical protein
MTSSVAAITRENFCKILCLLSCLSPNVSNH